MKKGVLGLGTIASILVITSSNVNVDSFSDSLTSDLPDSLTGNINDGYTSNKIITVQGRQPDFQSTQILLPFFCIPATNFVGVRLAFNSFCQQRKTAWLNCN